MNPARILMALVGASSLAYAVEPGLPPLDPLPHASPLVPMPDNPADLTQEQRLQRLLDQQVRDADRKIEALRAKYGDLQPDNATATGPKLDAPRKERDQAWQDLQKSLHAFDDHAANSKHDILEAGRPAAQAAQVGPLSVVNQLRIASCYQELASSASASAADLHDGQVVLDQIDPAELPESERPRYHYLRVWFFAEQARLSDGTDRAGFIKSANTSLQALQQLRADSELTSTARSLLIGLDGSSKDKAPGKTLENKQ